MITKNKANQNSSFWYGGNLCDFPFLSNFVIKLITHAILVM